MGRSTESGDDELADEILASSFNNFVVDLMNSTGSNVSANSQVEDVTATSNGADTEIEFTIASTDNDSAAAAGEFLATRMASETFSYMGESVAYSNPSCFITLGGACQAHASHSGIEVTCGNNITISVGGSESFPVDFNNAGTGLVAGFTEFCDKNGLAPTEACKFTEFENTHSLVISNFSSCDVSSQYVADEDVTEVTVLVSSYVNSTVTAIRRSECGRFAVVCRYNRKLENVTFETSINVTTHDYVGANETVDSTAEAGLYLIISQGTGDAAGDDISDGTTYGLKETIHVEARLANNTDKFVSTVSLYTPETFASFVK